VFTYMKYTHYLIQILLGFVGGGVASLAAVLLFKGLYALSYAVADQAEGWLAVGAIAVLLIITSALSGLLAGGVGGVVGGLIVWRLWHPFGSWLVAWFVVWALTGMGLWVSYIQSRQGNFDFGLESSRWWLLLGIVLALAFGLIAPPWRS
jgi:multisubunit Na+/H+ antiporter MnhB subunit